MTAFSPFGWVVYNLQKKTTRQTKFLMDHIKLVNKNINTMINVKK